ncbi:MAG: hypothetical protein ACETVZ_08025 [Phycisphaerae bacterium]
MLEQSGSPPVVGCMLESCRKGKSSTEIRISRSTDKTSDSNAEFPLPDVKLVPLIDGVRLFKEKVDSG